MSDCANEAMADQNGLNLPTTEVGSCNMIRSNFDSAHTTNTSMNRMSSGAGAAAAHLLRLTGFIGELPPPHQPWLPITVARVS